MQVYCKSKFQGVKLQTTLDHLFTVHTPMGMTSSSPLFKLFPGENDACEGESGGKLRGSSSRCQRYLSDKKRPGLEKHRKRTTDLRGLDSVCVWEREYRVCVSGRSRYSHGTVTVNLPLHGNVSHAYTVELGWVTVRPVMSQILLIYIFCPELYYLKTLLPVSLQEQRDEDYIPKQRTCVCFIVMHNLLGEILCIINAGMRYGNVVWPLYDRGSASMHYG